MLYYADNSHWIPGTKTIKYQMIIYTLKIYYPLRNIIDKLHLNHINKSIIRNNFNTHDHGNTIHSNENDLYT